MDWMDEANVYRDLIMTNIEYDILCERYGEERMSMSQQRITGTGTAAENGLTLLIISWRFGDTALWKR